MSGGLAATGHVTVCAATGSGGEALALCLAQVPDAVLMDVRLEGETLVCDQCRRVYPIRDGIPEMLVESATIPGESAAEDKQEKPT